MNGRCFHDKHEGKTTCDGKSVIDYIACSPKLLTQCTNFEILEFNPLLSDKHCPISVSFNNYSNSGIHEPKNRPIIQETITRVNWSNEHEKSFTSSIDQIKVNAALQMITNIEQKEIIDIRLIK
jgi:hypothetical protein